MNDGGSAFPNTATSDGHATNTYQGMSLRDYFAAKAMQAIVSNPECQRLTAKQYGERADGSREYFEETNADGIAENAYFMADAMLKASEKGRESNG